MFIAPKREALEHRQEFNVPAGRETHSTPKEVSLCAEPDGYEHTTTTWLQQALGLLDAAILFDDAALGLKSKQKLAPGDP
jgi:hypothetical protein